MTQTRRLAPPASRMTPTAFEGQPRAANGFAIHLCADVARAGADRWRPASFASADTVCRATELVNRDG